MKHAQIVAGLRSGSLPNLFAVALLAAVASAQQPVEPAPPAPPAETPAAADPGQSGSISGAKLERIHRNNRRKAEEMMAKDSRVVPARDMSELEQTYQAANRNPRTPEAIEALEKVVKKYPKTNRAGCAALYLGRWTRGNDQEKYLELAVQKYSDSYYLDGTSVGGYARLILGAMYQQTGKRTKAEKLFEEIRKDYAEAQDHTGRLIVNLIPK
jgi:tetratricopeptide (TPR) repeat protein